MRLSELLKVLENPEIEREGNVEIEGLAYDSRKVRPGTLFFAIPGLETDGHEFVSDALSRGASALVVERALDRSLLRRSAVPVIRISDSRKAIAQISSFFYGEPSKNVKMIGITGTNGKTTTAYLLQSILKENGLKTGLIGTIDCWVGEEKRKAEKTTPESLDLQRTLSEMIASDVKAVVMEVSSHGLALQRTQSIDFDVALFTNLSRDHLDFHGSMPRYAQAKMRLFDGLTEGRKAILNFDDPYTEKIQKTTKATVITYGMEEGAEFRGVLQALHLDGSEMEVHWKGRKATLSSPLPGRPNLYNFLAALAFGISEGFSEEKVLKGIEEVKGIEGRWEAIKEGQPFKVFVDYAHTPDALRKVLLALKELTPGQVIVIFGCGGDRDQGKRPSMGKISTSLADFTILTSDNPRREDPQIILQEIEKGVVGNDYGVIPDRREAILSGIERAREGDTLLIAGKGHESYQIIGDQHISFDDREVAREILKRKFKMKNDK